MATHDGYATVRWSGASNPVVRILPLILCLPALVAAQDAAEVMRRALAEDTASAAIARVVALLALGGAFGCFGVTRREALWAAGAAATIRADQLPGTTLGMTAPPLPAMTAAEETFADLWATGTYGTHPIEHIRALLDELRAAAAAHRSDR